MLTRKFGSLYYDVISGFGNGSILHIIEVSFIFRIYSTLTLLLLFLFIGSTVIILTIVAQPSFAQVAAPKGKNCPNCYFRTIR